jgi:pimeloyl-ACP methyl ester carboxylesterase
MLYVAVAGTWAQHDAETAIDPWRDWWHPQSHWAAELRVLGWTPLRPDPFRWSTDLDGTWLQRLVQRRRWGDWLAAAYALCYYCDQVPDGARRKGPRGPAARPVLIAHSHGGQVALLATGLLGLSVAGLVTVCTPVRADVLDLVGADAPQPWWHLYSDGADRWQWLGEWGDGLLRVARQMPPPAINLPAAVGFGHSGLLTTRSGLRVWPDLLRRLEAAVSKAP